MSGKKSTNFVKKDGKKDSFKTELERDIEEVLAEAESITGEEVGMGHEEPDRFVTTLKGDESIEHGEREVDPLEHARIFDRQLWEDTSCRGRMDKFFVYSTRWLIILMSPLMHDLIIILAVSLSQFSFANKASHDLYKAFTDSIGIGVAVMMIFMIQLALRNKYATILDKKTNKRIIFLGGGRVGCYQVCEFFVNFLVFLILIIAASVEASRCQEKSGFCFVVDAYFNSLTDIIVPNGGTGTNGTVGRLLR